MSTGPEFNPRTHEEKLGVMSCVCNPRAEEEKTGGRCGLLVSHSSLPDELRGVSSLISKDKVEHAPEERVKPD